MKRVTRKKMERKSCLENVKRERNDGEIINYLHHLIQFPCFRRKEDVKKCNLLKWDN